MKLLRLPTCSALITVASSIANSPFTIFLARSIFAFKSSYSKCVCTSFSNSEILAIVLNSVTTWLIVPSVNKPSTLSCTTSSLKNANSDNVAQFWSDFLKTNFTRFALVGSKFASTNPLTLG